MKFHVPGVVTQAVLIFCQGPVSFAVRSRHKVPVYSLCFSISSCCICLNLACCSGVRTALIWSWSDS